MTRLTDADRLVVVGDHRLSVTRIYNQYRVWCPPHGVHEWFDRLIQANEFADHHVYGDQPMAAKDAVNRATASALVAQHVREGLTGDCSVDCVDGCAYPGQFSECES